MAELAIQLLIGSLYCLFINFFVEISPKLAASLEYIQCPQRLKLPSQALIHLSRTLARLDT